MNYKYLNKDTAPKGISKTLLYKIWMGKRQCCYNTKHKAYKHYGARGIKMFEEWVDNPLPFIEYIKKLDGYDSGLQLDRIDNNGDYEPGNLRWASIHIQLCNRRKQKNNTSGYTGITFCKIGKYDYWRAEIYYYGKLKYIGYYKTKEEALTRRNNYIIENDLKEYKLQEQ